MNRALLIFFLGLIAQPMLAQDVQVQGLFSGRAVLNVDGKLRMLKEGESSPEGIRLISADTQRALVEINGERRELNLSSRISSSFKQAASNEVKLFADAQGHYQTEASINGRSARVLVDTGASLVAINSNQADLLGIKYIDGRPGRASTASGMVPTKQVTLHSVRIGSINMTNVEAVVIEGEFPEVILLGNSFLSRLEMRNDGKLLVMKAPY